MYVEFDSTLYDISPTPAILTSVPNPKDGGYGDYNFSYGTYGTPRPPSSARPRIPPLFSIDNWGEDLLVMSSVDGRLLRWSPTDGPNTKAAVVPEAPVGFRGFVVTPQRIVVMFSGPSAPGYFRWCDQEDISNWALNDINSISGDYNIQPSAYILTSCVSGNSIVMFMSDNTVNVLDYIGNPYIWSVNKVKADSIPISSYAVTDTPMGAVWFSNSGFWYYSAGEAVGVDCPVFNWLKKRMGASEAQVYSSIIHNPDMSELYFFFPRPGETENSRYVMWNYKENWWTVGVLHRLCGTKSPLLGNPVWANKRDVYIHEYGEFYDIRYDESPPWIKSHSIMLPGNNMITVGRVIPDTGGDCSMLEFSMDYTIDRAGQDNIPYNTGIKKILRGSVWFRATGRDFRLIVAQPDRNVYDWTLGNSTVEINGRGTV